eukprot:1457806-Pyramimonas_sp.AAC.1
MDPHTPWALSWTWDIFGIRRTAATRARPSGTPDNATAHAPSIISGVSIWGQRRRQWFQL